MKRGGWGKVTMISRGVEISIAGGGGEMVRGLSLGHFSFFFFFVIIRSLFFRYKKPHAALAMERTKPINQNINKGKSRHQLNVHYRSGFSSAGPTASYNKESTTNNSVVW